MEQPKVKFDVTTLDGSQRASEFVEAMLSKLPFDKRHAWLTSKGWIEASQYNRSKHRLYVDPRYTMRALNQTRACFCECWHICESKGIIYRKETRRYGVWIPDIGVR